MCWKWPPRRLWFVVCFGKLSLSDIPIRNNQAASDRASTVAKVPSKWCGHQKRTEFRPCWHVKCGMSLYPAGSIQLRVSHCPIDLQRRWRFPYMQLFWWFLRRRWDQLCAGNRVISKGLWPPCSPDLTPPDYFLWGYLKGRVYQNTPRTTDTLKTNITEEIQAVTADVLARTF